MVNRFDSLSAASAADSNASRAAISSHPMGTDEAVRADDLRRIGGGLQAAVAVDRNTGQKPGVPETGEQRETEQRGSIFAFVADRVEFTGAVDYAFTFNSDMSMNDLGVIISKYPNRFGWVKTIDDPEDKRDAHVYVFEGGKGQIASIPVYPEGPLSWRESVSHIPDCVLLTDASSMEKLERACREAGISLQSYQHNGVMKTSYSRQ